VHDLVTASGGDVPLLVLHRLVVAIRGREEGCDRAEERDRWAVVRAAVHQALGSRGSRVALYDLRETVEQSNGPLPLGMLAALAAIGDASCLDAIAGAYQRVDDAWHRERLTEAVRAIVAREGLTRRHAVMKRLTARVPALFS
jgi:HEAT repeat protein